jgi:glycosyltransferase involved in cell wall biosynthesis
MRTAIVIPTCDRPPDLLNRALSSVKTQARPADVVVVVNDGHSAVDLPGTTVVKTNGWEGLAAARELGVKAAIGAGAEVIGYVDDDDELLPDHIWLLAKEIEAGAKFAFSRARFQYANGTHTEDPEPDNHDPNKRYYDPSALLRQNIAPVSSYMHSAGAYERVGGWDRRIMRMEDWDLWGRLFLEFGQPAYVPAITNVIHRGHGPNLTTSSPFGYSMCCSWRDLVSDRLRRLASLGRGRLEPGDWEHNKIPRVGVVMPVYNAAKHLRQGLDSLMGQTYKDFEVLAINDGSTDESRQILGEYSDKFGNVRIFDFPRNHGVAKALNLGLMVSRSEYVARMDADDVCVPERLFEQVSYLDIHRDIGVVGSRFISMDEALLRVIWDNSDIPLDPDSIKKEMDKRCCIGHPTVMMRRRVIEVVGGYSEDESTKHAEDYDLWLRVVQKFKVANMDSCLLLHRVHGNQMSSKFSSLQQENTRKTREGTTNG